LEGNSVKRLVICFDGTWRNADSNEAETNVALIARAIHANVDTDGVPFVPTLWTGEPPRQSRIEQVWFAGAHSDVGGGYIDRGLADIPLRWMADQATECGLKLDASMLPAPPTLDPLAPLHESRSWFAIKDRFTPSIRCVCETPVDVAYNERLYRPIDARGRPLPTINESIHKSVADRYGKEAFVSDNDRRRTRERELYEPRNLEGQILM
jgi:Uncharacterized alpha/beta hydrolase domain (DUF2235)